MILDLMAVNLNRLKKNVYLLLCYIVCFFALNICIRDIITARRSVGGAVDANLEGITSNTQALGHINNLTVWSNLTRQHRFPGTHRVSQPMVTFPSFYKPTCKKVWRGDFAQEFLLRNASSVVVVVSFCKGELDTLFGNLQDISIQGVFVYSKCGNLDIPAHFLERLEGIPEDRKTIVSLPNVGRVDHNVGHFIINHSTALAVDDVVLFLKDNYHIVHQHNQESVALPTMVRIAAGDLGFACGLIPRIEASLQFSPWHETSELHNFRMEEYKSGATSYNQSDTQIFSRGENLGQWLEAVQIKLPTPLTPVCYGGNFAVRSAHLHAARDAAKRMELSLRRGDNIIEGHFAERTWAGLLMADIPNSLSNTLVSMHTNANYFSPDMPGMLVGCA